MKKIVAALVLVITLILPTGLVAAQANVLDPVCSSTPEATACQENNKQQDAGSNSIYGPNGILTKVVQMLLVVIGAVSVIMIIIGGFKYVTSSGDPSNVSSAKNTILYAIIGLVVAIFAQTIIIFVIGRL